MELFKLWEILKDREAWHAAVYGVTKSWTMKKVEWQKIDVFELWCWRKLSSLLDSKEFKLVNPRGNQP